MVRVAPPTDPWAPRTFSAWVEKGVTKSRGAGAKPVDCWDVKGRADGVQWQKRFLRAGQARAWADRLEADYAAGLLFDVRARQFVVPEGPAALEPPTVFTLTERFFFAHTHWEPRTKAAAAASFNRARRWLLAPGIELAGGDLQAVDDYLANAAFLPDRLQGTMTERQRHGRGWLERHSADAATLTRVDVEGFVARSEVNQRNPAKKVSAATLVRLLQPLKACWAWAVEREDIPVEHNPWALVRPRRKVKGRSSVGGRAALAVDADMVPGPAECFRLAEACAEHGSWGGVVECFVLVMALCGLRPGEAAGLLWEDVDLPPGGGAGWLTVRRSHRPTAARWLDDGEDPTWGPLKDRDIAEVRRAPIHPDLVEKLRHHRLAYGEGPGGLVFHRKDRPFDDDLFSRNVWEPGRSAMFPRRPELARDDPRQPKLSRLRKHDLRHAACSWWLREGVDAVVCQRWSGHKTLSVFLDIYQGVAPGREEEGVSRLTGSRF